MHINLKTVVQTTSRYQLTPDQEAGEGGKKTYAWYETQKRTVKRVTQESRRQH